MKVCFFQGDLHHPLWPVVCSEAIIAVKVPGIYLDLPQIIAGPSPKPGHDDVASNIIAGGFKVGLVPVLYGLIVYFVSLILRVIHKPRI